MLLTILAAVGLILSTYFIYVEYRLTRDKHYQALCDITKDISCTKAAKSCYGNLFKVSNAALGAVFYAAVGLLAFFGLDHYIFLLSIPAAIMTFYLIYVSYAKAKIYCLICHGVYIVNIAILIVSMI